MTLNPPDPNRCHRSNRRPDRGTYHLVSALLPIVAGCATILGANFDHPGMSADAGVADEGTMPSQAANGACRHGEKACNGGCVALTNPSFGCSSTTSCEPCSLSHGTASCDASGQCGVGTCDYGRGNCSGASQNCDTNLETNPAHCGACNKKCPPEQVCGLDGCASNCPYNTLRCDRSCVDLTSDAANCGECGKACPKPANGVGTCTTHVCGRRCNVGFAPCGANGGECCAVAPTCSPTTCANGCCEGSVCQTGTTTYRCGAHGRACQSCPAPENGEAACTSGSCSFTCKEGFVPAGAACAPTSVAWASQVSGVTTTLSGVWGSGSSDVYAVGDKGTILHTTGNGVWTPQTSGTTANLKAVWGSGRQNVYAVGDSATILYSAGNGQWKAMVVPPDSAFSSIWGQSMFDVYAVGSDGVYHSGGNGDWDRQEVGYGCHGIRGVWGSDSNDVYVVGANPQTEWSNARVCRSKGFQNWSSTGTLPAATLISVWGSGRNDIYAGAHSCGNCDLAPILHSTGDSTWTAEALPVPASRRPDVVALWGSGPTDVYALSYFEIYHSQGAGVWSELATPKIGGSAIWGSGPHDIYVVGATGTILHGF